MKGRADDEETKEVIGRAAARLQGQVCLVGRLVWRRCLMQYLTDLRLQPEVMFVAA